MAEQPYMNFFTDELYQYYLEQGITLSEEIISVLNKIPLRLSGSEREVFLKFILPRRHQMKQFLRTRFIHSGADEQVWHDNLLLYSESVIGQIASEMLIEEEVSQLKPTPSTEPGPTALPTQVVPPEEPTPAAQPEKKRSPILPISIKQLSPRLNINIKRRRRMMFTRKRRVGRLAAVAAFAGRRTGNSGARPGRSPPL